MIEVRRFSFEKTAEAMGAAIKRFAPFAQKAKTSLTTAFKPGELEQLCTSAARSSNISDATKRIPNLLSAVKPIN